MNLHKSRKERIEDLSKEFSIKQIDRNTRIVHVLSEVDLSLMKDDFKQFIKDCSDGKLIEMYTVYFMVKKLDEVDLIVAMKNLTTNEYYYTNFGLHVTYDGIWINFPYFFLYQKIENNVPIIVCDEVEYTEGKSDYLFNEMQFNKSGRLKLYWLFENNYIKKPKYLM